MMKRIILLIILIFTVEGVFSQSDYYWYRGGKINLTINKNLYYLSSPDSTKLSSPNFGTYAVSSVVQKGSFLEKGTKRYWKIVHITNSQSLKEMSLSAIYSNKSDTSVYIAPVIGDSIPVATNEYFSVKLKAKEGKKDLEEEAKKLSCQIVKQVEYMPLWYELRSPYTSNGLEMSNKFYETGKFAAVDPNFMLNYKDFAACTNDPLFGQQWGLQNSNGIDINACNAWNITRGNPNVTVAVVDQGIDPKDKEFANNYSPLSYDVLTHSSPPTIIYGEHGTHVGGIIGAEQNGYQISGVAPLTTLMSVNDDMGVRPSMSQEMASAISYAWQNGAAVINNSWGDQGGALYNYLYSATLDDAIATAISSGRNGLGSIVVFSSGNWNTALDYPASSNPNILAVGSIDSNGSRSSFSSYGTNLGVVAPGSNILSTLPGNTTGVLSGTSMAAPHVSGIAALILAINPSATGAEVRNYIESTCRKVGSYNYNQNYPNGMWNNEMGYGLVDAYAALVKANCTTTNYENLTVSTNTTVTACNINIKNVTVNNNAKLTVNASGTTNIISDFYVNQGASLEIP